MIMSLMLVKVEGGYYLKKKFGGVIMMSFD